MKIRLYIILIAVLLTTGCQRESQYHRLCHEAYDAYDRMEYVEAASKFRSVLDGSADHLLWLPAEVGMMELCQRVSDNVSFYEYRNDALLEIRGLRNEYETLSEEQQRVLRKNEARLRIVSARYYHELAQPGRAAQEFRQIDDEVLNQDTTLLAMWYWLRGQGMDNSADDFDERMYDLNTCYHLGALSGNAFLCALAQQTMAEMNADDLTALSALQTFLHEGYTLQVIETYGILAQNAIYREEYRNALDWLTKSLDLLNDNLYNNYDLPDLPRLEPFREDGLVVENLWIEYAPMAAVPECMSRIRELMGLAFSGLDDKVASDYNRNVCLELQKTIRLDRRYEARTKLLKKTHRRLNVTLNLMMVFIILSLVMFILMNRYLKKSNLEYSEKTRNLMDQLIRMLSTDDVDESLMPEGLAPYVSTALRKARTMDSMAQKRGIMEKERWIQEKKEQESVRQNLMRKASFSVIADCRPLIDRMLAEIHHLQDEQTEQERSDRLLYIEELAAGINSYNDILTRWIGTNRGLVDLSIENFSLEELFEMIRHSERSFIRDGLTLQVPETDAIAKADRALTLFMINTLTDNAHKFTPKDGVVTLSAQTLQDCIEVSVQDTGAGMTQEEVNSILIEKVYNAERIGLDNESVAARKGSGFGLMNCKGIIEKYRKNGDFFACCAFGVESNKGQGSRIWFRLPKGVRRALGVLALSMLTLQGVSAQETSDSLLVEAYIYAECTYEMNVQGEYELAVMFADSAIANLNRDYAQWKGADADTMALISEDVAAETLWLSDGFATDYETILWLRNEIAVAALALHDWDLYYYNNEAYLQLFRMYYAETEIARDSLELQRSNSNLTIAIILFLFLLTVVTLLWFLLYIRHQLKYRSDLMQLADVIKVISDSCMLDENEDVQDVLERVGRDLLPQMQQLLSVSGLALSVPGQGRLCQASAGDAPESPENCAVVIPLVYETDGKRIDVGTLGLQTSEDIQESEEAIRNMIARYLGVMLYNCVEKPAEGFRSLEQLKDESEKISYEMQRLHVRNMILDNCLSTIKHETLWYPNRILQIVSKNGAEGEYEDLLQTVTYYREIFGVLSQNAQRQIDEKIFKRQTVSVSALLSSVEEWGSKRKMPLVVQIPQEELQCVADRQMLQILLESMTEARMTLCSEGDARLTAAADGKFVRFTMVFGQVEGITDPEKMFSPLWRQDNRLLVVCRQIIREHDEALNHPGCRINAETCTDGLLQVWFTVPVIEQKQ